jgi:hypothetical protein
MREQLNNCCLLNVLPTHLPIYILLVVVHLSGLQLMISNI